MAIMAYKYYHKIIKHDSYYIDAVYLNWALPSRQLRNLQYSDDSENYISHNKFKKNPLTGNFIPTPYPSIDYADPYSFLKKFLSFVKQDIEKCLSIFSHENNIAQSQLLDWLEKIHRMPKNWSKPEPVQGLRITLDSHHNILFQFDGKFFKEKTFQKDVKKFKDVASIINRMLEFHIYNIAEWRDTIDNPRITIYQMHLAENLLFKKYKSGFNFKPKIVGSKRFKDSVRARPQIKQGSWTIPCELNPLGKEIISGYSYGIPGRLKVTIYDKSLDEEGRQHSIERFGTDQYFRREFQIGRKKLEACKIKFLDNFFVQIKCNHFKSNIIRKIRMTTDILMKNDKPFYTRFHDQNDRLSLRDQKKLKNPLRFSKVSFTRMKIDSVDEKELEKQVFNPYKYIVGNLNSKNSKNILPEELLDICMQSIILMLKNTRTGYYLNAKTTVNSHVEGIDLINKLKNFTQHFSTYRKNKDIEYPPHHIDDFISGYSESK